MTVYVDEAIIPWRGQRWAHLLGSDLEELHAFAATIGLRRSWFQAKRIPHYDVTTGKRLQALAAGAVEIEAGELPDDIIRLNPEELAALAPHAGVRQPRATVPTRVPVRPYTGVGSRTTPDDILALFRAVAYQLACRGWKLRSGCAPGADSAFEQGALDAYLAVPEARPKPELYLPWPRFEGRRKTLVTLERPQPEAFPIAAQFHPAWDKLKDTVRPLHARNVHQVLGPDVTAPVISRFLVCWTPGGKGAGGTGQAIRIARHYGVEVIDAGGEEGLARLQGFLHPAEEQA